MAFATIGTAGIQAQSIDLTTKVTGTLPVPNGGLGIASGTTGQYLKFSGTETLASATAGVDNADHWVFVTPATDQNSNGVVDFNTQMSKGSNITESGGRMTVATAGLYAIDFHFSNAGSNGDNMNVYLRKNTTRQIGSIVWEGNTEIGYMGMHGHVLIQASANDIFDIYGSGYWSGNTNNQALTWFCGIRLGA